MHIKNLVRWLAALSLAVVIAFPTGVYANGSTPRVRLPEPQGSSTGVFICKAPTGWEMALKDIQINGEKSLQLNDGASVRLDDISRLVIGQRTNGALDVDLYLRGGTLLRSAIKVGLAPVFLSGVTVHSQVTQVPLDMCRTLVRSME